MSEYFKVPKLGQHYTQRWAKEDLENERMKGSGSGNPGDNNDNTNDGSSTSRMLRKAGK